jgi:hypothetical protein
MVTVLKFICNNEISASSVTTFKFCGELRALLVSVKVNPILELATLPYPRICSANTFCTS